jgi:hypothetical protein
VNMKKAISQKLHSLEPKQCEVSDTAYRLMANEHLVSEAIIDCPKLYISIIINYIDLYVLNMFFFNLNVTCICTFVYKVRSCLIVLYMSSSSK